MEGGREEKRWGKEREKGKKMKGGKRRERKGGPLCHGPRAALAHFAGLLDAPYLDSIPSVL